MQDIEFLARTADAAGYWGRHPDGVHHAIASCCDEGASRGGVFVVYSGPASMKLRCDPVSGGLVWDIDEANPDAEPMLEGIYDASGVYLGENLAQAAKDAKDGLFQPEDNAVDWEHYRQLREYRPDKAETVI